MSGINLFGSESKTETKVRETNQGGTLDTRKGTQGNVSGKKNKQNLASGRGIAGNDNKQVSANGRGVAGAKNHQTNTSGLGIGGSIAGRGNRQEIGRGNAFQGADMSINKAAGDLSHIGDHSDIGGDFINKDYQVELVADHGAKITFQQPDTGMSDAIAGLGRALGKTSTSATVQVGDGLKRAQEADMSRQIMYGLGGLLLAYIFIRRN